MTDEIPIRNASTIILVRDTDSTPAVLMGQRGAKAAFMPSMFVFPGGAVDAGDADVGAALSLSACCEDRLLHEPTSDVAPSALAAAALRELWEETGLRMARPGAWQGAVPQDWEGFAADGLMPDATPLHFIFRAITPRGRPRRFDARFFLGDAAALVDDPDDFSRASDELSHLQWIPIAEAKRFQLPFITQVVLAEVASNLPVINAPEAVPFYDNRTEPGVFRYVT